MLRSIFAVLVVAALGCAGPQPATSDVSSLSGKRAAVDAPVPDFRLRNLMEDEPAYVSLSQFRGKTVVLYFLSHQCQTSWAYEGRIGKILGDFRDKPVVFLGVASSSQDKDDATRKYAEAKNFDVPVLADEGNVVADYFGVPQTPIFVVIARGTLCYWGSLDDHPNEAKVKNPYLRRAIEAAVAGQKPPTPRGLGIG